MRALLCSLSLFCGLALSSAPSAVTADVRAKADSTSPLEIDAAVIAGFDDGIEGSYENPPFHSTILDDAYDLGWYVGYVLWLIETGGDGD
jgi:hypothetical protein